MRSASSLFDELGADLDAIPNEFRCSLPSSGIQRLREPRSVSPVDQELRCATLSAVNEPTLRVWQSLTSLNDDTSQGLDIATDLQGFQHGTLATTVGARQYRDTRQILQVARTDAAVVLDADGL